MTWDNHFFIIRQLLIITNESAATNIFKTIEINLDQTGLNQSKLV